MMLSCKQASELSSEALDRRLSPSERLRLAIHLSLCRLCRRYRRQIHILHQAALRLRRDDAPIVHPLDDATRRRITERIKTARDEKD